MTEVKMRSENHVIEKKSIAIIEELLPAHWVNRPYNNPDYGIDLSLEIFEKKKDGLYATQGEHIYIQVKGTESISYGQYKIYERNNIEKFQFEKKEIYRVIDVVNYQLDTSELLTVEKMGSAVPVMLFVVDIIEKCIYYICLNDYIEKLIVPEDPNYYTKQTKVIHIPCSNKITSENDIFPLLWYAKRPKLFAMFNKIKYQHNEIGYLGSRLIQNNDTIRHFADILLRMDAWQVRQNWPIVNKYYQELINLRDSGYLQGSKDAFRKEYSAISKNEWEEQDKVQ